MTDNTLDDLARRLRQFASDRDWEQFHSPKNLTMALAVEAAELMEHFQWLTEDASRQLPAETLDEVGEEIADVMLYLVRLADVLKIDLAAVTAAKMLKNAAKYPADKVRGKSDKYSKY
jgi:dCTP diphosphatase